jgi:hypothetical protein
VIALIAGLILAAEVILNHAPLELVVLGTALAAAGSVSLRMHKTFRASPINFPVPTGPQPTPIDAGSLCTGYRRGKGTRR